MNKVILTGNLTRDPEIGTTPNGVNYCRFSIAVQRRFTNQNGEREADFINCVAWRQSADFIHNYAKKGIKLGVCGNIQTRTYEVDGQKRYSTEVIVDEVEILTPKGDSSNSGNYGAAKPQRAKASLSEMQPMEDDDLPF